MSVTVWVTALDKDPETLAVLSLSQGQDIFNIWRKGRVFLGTKTCSHWPRAVSEGGW